MESFAGRILSRIERLGSDQVESFLTHLLKEKNFLKGLFDSLMEGVVVSSAQGRVLFLNDAACGLLGIPKAKAAGAPLRTMLRAKALVGLLDEFLENPHGFQGREVRVRTPAPRVYAVTIIPIENDNGILTHSVWVVNDQTETHRRAAEAQQVESLKSLATLTAGIAHEIKNPLNSLNIHAQLIEKAVRQMDETPPEAADLDRLRQSTGVLLEEIQRLAKVVDQFLAAARPVRTNLQPWDLNAILRAVLDLVGPECNHRGIHLEPKLDASIPRALLDPHQFQQAVLNIVRNAIEAIDKPDGHIIVRTRASVDRVIVEVEDNGCGIDAIDRERIFEPYHTTKFNGTGLGLMVVYRIVSAHHGAIDVTSEVDTGTVFKIAIPMAERPIRMLPGGPIDVEAEPVEE